jgi:hypothetical protein
MGVWKVSFLVLGFPFGVIFFSPGNPPAKIGQAFGFFSVVGLGQAGFGGASSVSGMCNAMGYQKLNRWTRRDGHGLLVGHE